MKSQSTYTLLTLAAAIAECGRFSEPLSPELKAELDACPRVSDLDLGRLQRAGDALARSGRSRNGSTPGAFGKFRGSRRARQLCRAIAGRR